MTDLQNLLGLIALFLFVLVIGGIIADYAESRWYAEPWQPKTLCTCGRRDCPNRGRHPGWKDRAGR